MVTPLILAIAPAAASGAAILTSPGELPADLLRPDRRHLAMGLCHWRVVKKATERAEVVQEARDWAKALKTKVVVVGEEWKVTGNGGKRWNTQTISGVGAAWGRWLEALELAGHPARRVTRIDTGTWRSRLFGGRRRKGEEYKRMAVRWCLARYDIELPHDVAEAVCLGNVALRDPEVRKLMPQRRVKVRRTG